MAERERLLLLSLLGIYSKIRLTSATNLWTIYIFKLETILTTNVTPKKLDLKLINTTQL